LLPNIDYNDNNYSDINNEKIYIVQFPFGKNMSHSKGKIININKYEFIHKASTEPGSSGSPVFLEQSTKVIGIHKQSDINKNNNFGDFIFPIINKLKFIYNNKKDENKKQKEKEKPKEGDEKDGAKIETKEEHKNENDNKEKEDKEPKKKENEEKVQKEEKIILRPKIKKRNKFGKL